ncbi:MAG: ABC transporter ATP-binding protein [Bacillales bacterium]|nr:ABC transporter ATP-binding protein [Bacillales bacterium]
MEIIKIENLKKTFKDVCAVNDVSLTINEGETYGLLGVNGAGKTTIINILSGLLKKDEGEIYVNNMKIENINEIKRIIDISPQVTSVASNLTVLENLTFFQSLYDVKDEAYLNYLIEKFSLKEVLNKKAKTLSGGYQRRLSISIGLISKPKILFLDEPTLGLDVISRRELWKIIKELKGKMTIIITSHYLEEIEALCDRISIMSKGKVIVSGTIEDIKRDVNETSFEEAFIKVVGGE